MIKQLSFILFGILAVAGSYSSEKFVIGQHRCGFFSCFFGALNNLIWCAENNKIPVMYWNESSLYFDERDTECKDNAWNCFFKPVSNQKYVPGDHIHNEYATKNGQIWVAVPPCSHQRFFINEVIQKWIHINDTIQAIVNNFYENHLKGKKTIGIHIRRTDKSDERPHIPLNVIFDCANSYDVDQYFVATDEEEILQAAKVLLKKPVICFNARRSINGLPIHYDKEQPNKTQSGREVLIEALLLSRTDFFIHTISNVSTAVLYFNPQLPHVELY